MDSHTHSAFGRLEIVETGRRRRWSDEEKRRIVAESMVGDRQVSATARRHDVSRSQLLAWRRALLAEASAARSFVPAVVVPDAAAPASAAASEAAPPRIEIVLRSGRRIIVDAAADMDAVLKLARGLEAIR